MSQDNVKVFVRVRPSSTDEACVEADSSNGTVRLFRLDGRPEKTFAFDATFGGTSSQSDVFDCAVKPLVDSVLDGYDGTVFAYGQTGSGKTHTMVGDPTDPQKRGVMPRAFQHLFGSLEAKFQEANGNLNFTLECAFVELYCEKFYDLLLGRNQPVVTKPSTATASDVVPGASSKRLQSARDAMDLLRLGMRNRHTAPTAMNRESSRSHAVFVIRLTMEQRSSVGEPVQVKQPCLYLVDLAGSERRCDTNATGQRAKEANIIHKSLLTLSRIIADLASGAEHVPKRESKLTYLLRDSLGGDSRTVLIATVHSNKNYLSQTKDTLQYASLAKKIRNNATVQGEKTNAEGLRDIVELQKQTLDRKDMELGKKNEVISKLRRTHKLIDKARKRRLQVERRNRTHFARDASLLAEELKERKQENDELRRQIGQLELQALQQRVAPVRSDAVAVQPSAPNDLANTSENGRDLDHGALDDNRHSDKSVARDLSQDEFFDLSRDVVAEGLYVDNVAKGQSVELLNQLQALGYFRRLPIDAASQPLLHNIVGQTNGKPALRRNLQENVSTLFCCYLRQKSWKGIRSSDDIDRKPEVTTIELSDIVSSRHSVEAFLRRKETLTGSGTCKSAHLLVRFFQSVLNHSDGMTELETAKVRGTLDFCEQQRQRLSRQYNSEHKRKQEEASDASHGNQRSYAFWMKTVFNSKAFHKFIRWTIDSRRFIRSQTILTCALNAAEMRTVERITNATWSARTAGPNGDIFCTIQEAGKKRQLGFTSQLEEYIEAYRAAKRRFFSTLSEEPTDPLFLADTGVKALQFQHRNCVSFFKKLRSFKKNQTAVPRMEMPISLKELRKTAKNCDKWEELRAVEGSYHDA